METAASLKIDPHLDKKIKLNTQHPKKDPVASHLTFTTPVIRFFACLHKTYPKKETARQKEDQK